MGIAGQRVQPTSVEPSIGDVIYIAAEWFGVGPSRLVAPRRAGVVGRYRLATMAAVRATTSWSHAAIAEAFGAYDHTTSIKSVAKVAADPELSRWRDAIVTETRRRRA